jgi:phospholipid/cholesterol/gamma-HCH transport system substrate-binding protein
MRSTSSSRSVIVGIFTLLGIAILAVTILTLGDQRSTFNESVLVTSFYNNVNGLQKGNNIWFNGVKVGTIKSVDIIDNDSIEVKMNINQSARKFIHNDVKAKLSTDGLIGNKIVALFGGTSQAPVIKNGDVIQTDELLNTDAVMNTLSKNNDNLLAITDNLKKITTNIADGKGSLGKLLNDETLLDQITALAQSLNHSSDNLNKLTKAAADYTAKLNTPGSLANDLVTDTTIFNNLRLLTERLKEVSDSSQVVINNLKLTGMDLNKAIQNKETPIGMLMNDKAAAGNIKTTLTNLQSASKKLDEDLEALQHNFLLRGFFKKKAKEERKQRIVLDTLVGK